MNAIVGQSAWARTIREQILQVASYPASVLICGPSGTGKELIARSIHASSDRRDQPFVPVDCASIGGELFASHLFGHVPGAFTGANYSRLGCFRAAEGGTIFLDEIGELGGELQAKLLRTLQERTVVPVGADQGSPVDVRIVAATNRDLAAEVEAGRFRLDLYYRLNVVSLRTVPLKDRVEDIEILAINYLTRLAIENGLSRKIFSPEAIAALRGYEWPGNVHELQNAVERGVVFTPGDVIGPEFLPIPSICLSAQREAALDPSDVRVPAEAERALDRPWATLRDMEREHILKTLERTYGNCSAAARLLEIDRASLARKIKRFGIEMPLAHRGRPRGSAEIASPAASAVKTATG